MQAMRFTHPFPSRRALLGTLGLLALRQLPVASYPSVAPPALAINVSYPGAAAQIVEETAIALIEQEMSSQRWIDIPEEILSIYGLWRPTPLCRAKRLEEALKTPARFHL